MPPMSKSDGNAFSRESSRLRAAEVQQVRDQIAAAQANYGEFDASTPQARREQQRHQVDMMLREESGPQAGALLPTYSTVLRAGEEVAQQVSADRDEWYDTEEPSPPPLPTPMGGGSRQSISYISSPRVLFFCSML